MLIIVYINLNKYPNSNIFAVQTVKVTRTSERTFVSSESSM